uniref:Uncharacterized protein n=1 Tax=Oryza punctata TaxID=4537 RepID=A0A0E0KNJ6_ORYPU
MAKLRVLPNMKFLVSHKTRVQMRLVAWKGRDDPSTGDFSCSGDPNLNLQVFIRNGTKLYRRIIVFCKHIDDRKRIWEQHHFVVHYWRNDLSSGTKDTNIPIDLRTDASPYARITLDHKGDMKSLSWNGMAACRHGHSSLVNRWPPPTTASRLITRAT